MLSPDRRTAARAGTQEHMSSISSRIRRARRIARLSQADLSDRVGVQRSAVAQWEHDHGTRPTVENLARVAEATEVSFEWLATGRGPIRSDSIVDTGMALRLEDFAQDELEERLLAAVRRLPYTRRISFLEFAESFAIE